VAQATTVHSDPGSDVARGPICNDRLGLGSDGMAVDRFKREWKNGGSAVVLAPTPNRGRARCSTA